jgi:hypothetical protein
MEAKIIDVHVCYDGRTNECKVREYHDGLCSNHYHGDARVFTLAMPESEVSSFRRRIELGAAGMDRQRND